MSERHDCIGGEWGNKDHCYWYFNRNLNFHHNDQLANEAKLITT